MRHERPRARLRRPTRVSALGRYALLVAVASAPSAVHAQDTTPRVARADTIAPVGAVRPKSRASAGLLGLVLPGAGHWYARESGRGTLIAAVYWTGVAIVSGGRTDGVGKVGGVLTLGALVTSVVDGARAAGRYNARAVPPNRAPPDGARR